MLAKLNDVGKLELKRGKKGMVPAKCAYHPETACGDWCALFGEPAPSTEFPGQTEIQICHNTILTFAPDEFRDERKST